MAVDARDLVKAFEGKLIVDNVSVALRPGRILTLVGPSGCGKTTTLRLIAGFERLDAGHIAIAGREVASPGQHLAPERRRTGMVFQDYALFPHLSVGQNVGFALGRGKQVAHRVDDLLQFVGLPGYADKLPQQLSGGEQQRVSLARALSTDPIVLLLDEPFSNLDAALRTSVRAEVRDMLKARGTTAIFVTHDQEEALFLGDEVAVMMNGRIEQLGSPENVYQRPTTRQVAEFVGHTDFLPGLVTSAGIETPLGTLPQAIALASGNAVDVAVRPDDLILDANDEGNGTIVGRRFVGIAYVYQIRLNDGTEVSCWQPHSMNLPTGTRVMLTLDAGHDLPIFFQGQVV